MTRDYYCSNKFKYLKIDLEKGITYNCHAARPHKIDFQWLDKNPGNLFNNPTSVQERSMMLVNQRNSSCEQNCWPAEDKGQTSVRQIEKGYYKTHLETNCQPEILDLILDTDCNLKCVYCCKEYSSAWRLELARYGDYVLEQASQDTTNRYTYTEKDRVIQFLSQKQKQNSSYFQKVINEIASMVGGLKQVLIAGGEPFLSSQLFNILDLIRIVPDVKIFCGMGISPQRFQTIIDKLKKYPNVSMAISCEATDATYEFLRYGNKWSDFLKNFDILVKSGIQFHFQSTLTNLGIISFFDFYDRYNNYEIRVDFVYRPEFLNLAVIDEKTKKIVKDNCQIRTNPIFQEINKTVSIEPSLLEKNLLSEFLSEVGHRREVDYSFLPKDFYHWIK